MNALGSLVAQALSGSWRSTPPTPALPGEDWARVTPALLATASAGLAWWRARDSSLERTAAARECRDAYRLQTLNARLHEDRLARAQTLFERAGLRPVLAKGWAVARLYPRPGLRPYGDLDFHVAPEEHEAAAALVRTHEAQGLRVDLHRGVPRLGRAWRDVAARSREVALGGITVQVLGLEDHLALLCGHLLFHGAWRPLWLCDVALILETLPADFDWDHLHALPVRQVDEVRLVALLAHHVLGAELDRTPWRPGGAVPGWLPRATLRAWARGGHYSITAPLALTDRRSGSFLDAARLRWPNPIEATVRWRAPYNAFPRLPYQVLDAAVRGVRAVVGAPSLIASMRRRPDSESQ